MSDKTTDEVKEAGRLIREIKQLNFTVSNTCCKFYTYKWNSKTKKVESTCSDPNNAKGICKKKYCPDVKRRAQLKKQFKKESALSDARYQLKRMGVRTSR